MRAHWLNLVSIAQDTDQTARGIDANVPPPGIGISPGAFLMIPPS